MGTARIAPTTPLKRSPTFIKNPRLEAPRDGVIELLLLSAPPQAMPPHRRRRPATSACQASRCRRTTSPMWWHGLRRSGQEEEFDDSIAWGFKTRVFDEGRAP